jgi:hypothetical protein
MQLYSFLTGPDDETVCKRVSAKLNDGSTLYGSPSLTFDGKQVIAGQNEGSSLCLTLLPLS